MSQLYGSERLQIVSSNGVSDGFRYSSREMQQASDSKGHQGLPSDRTVLALSTGTRVVDESPLNRLDSSERESRYRSLLGDIRSRPSDLHAIGLMGRSIEVAVCMSVLAAFFDVVQQ